MQFSSDGVDELITAASIVIGPAVAAAAVHLRNKRDRGRLRTVRNLHPDTMASPSSNDDEKITNPYLAMREAKIARNQKRLSDLGLLKLPPPPKQQPMPKKPPQRNAPLRRSSRISSHTMPDEGEGGTITSAGKRTRDTPEVASADTLSISRKTRASIALTTTPPADQSVRSISLDIDYLILGNYEDHRDGLLGKILERHGKDYVIHKSFAKAAYLEDRQRLKGENTKLSFNKYSGVQEWKNCIFLWVNLGNEDSPNEFLDDGSSITWYGGSRMHESSPVFLKLIANSDDFNIVLWCRRYSPETKTLSPYVCFGRLKYRSHEHGSHPLKFVWDLDDYYDLLLHADFARVQTFNLFKEPL